MSLCYSSYHVSTQNISPLVTPQEPTSLNFWNDEIHCWILEATYQLWLVDFFSSQIAEFCNIFNKLFLISKGIPSSVGNIFCSKSVCSKAKLCTYCTGYCVDFNSLSQEDIVKVRKSWIYCFKQHQLLKTTYDHHYYILQQWRKGSVKTCQIFVNLYFVFWFIQRYIVNITGSCNMKFQHYQAFICI